MNRTSSKQAGFLSGAGVASIFLGILVLVFGSIMIWALVNYNDQKNNVDGKIAAGVELGKKEQKEADQLVFDEKEKEPLKEFIGPKDLGLVTFKYPKTWSVYTENNGATGNGYQAYMHPDAVPNTQSNKFALRMSIVNQSYEQVLGQYSPLVKQGQLRSSTVTTSGFNGTRLDGNFSQTVQGSAVVFKIRDKTLILRTDLTSFQPDFDEKIVKTLTFQQ